MSTVVIALIGILMAALATLAGFVYLDMDSGSALEGGVTASNGITSLAQSVESYTQSNGTAPTSLEQLASVSSTSSSSTEGHKLSGIGALPGLPNVKGAAWSMSPGFVCLVADRGGVADKSLRNAATRLGSGAMVSGGCGIVGEPTTAIVLSFPVAAGAVS